MGKRTFEQTQDQEQAQNTQKSQLDKLTTELNNLCNIQSGASDGCAASARLSEGGNSEFGQNSSQRVGVLSTIKEKADLLAAMIQRYKELQDGLMVDPRMSLQSKSPGLNRKDSLPPKIRSHPAPKRRKTDSAVKKVMTWLVDHCDSTGPDLPLNTAKSLQTSQSVQQPTLNGSLDQLQQVQTAKQLTNVQKLKLKCTSGESEQAQSVSACPGDQDTSTRSIKQMQEQSYSAAMDALARAQAVVGFPLVEYSSESRKAKKSLSKSVLQSPA